MLSNRTVEWIVAETARHFGDGSYALAQAAVRLVELGLTWQEAREHLGAAYAAGVERGARPGARPHPTP